MAGGNFVHRVMSYVANELIVSSLASSPAFQRFAVRTSRKIEDVSKIAKKKKQELAEQVKDISKNIEETVHDMEREENNSSMLEAESTHQLAASLDELEQILGYKFKDKKLLEEAFTHHSYDPNKSFSYERLEYVGDLVLGQLFAIELFSMYPNEGSDTLTRLRAANVDTEKLARVAVKHGLHQFLRHNLPLLQKQIREFSQAIVDYPLHSYGLIEVPKVLADIVESAVGATFIDDNCSEDTVWKVFKNLLEPMIRLETLKKDPVTELYEICSKRNIEVMVEDKWEECKSVNVFVDGKVAGKGTSASKKEIAQNNRSRADDAEKCRRVISRGIGLKPIL